MLLTLYPKSYFQLTLLDFMCFRHLLFYQTMSLVYNTHTQQQCWGHRKMGNRKVFESLQNRSTWACVTWTEPATSSLAETPWPSIDCAINFSVSACLHLFLCLFCLYCNLSHYFISHPSQTQWEGYFLLQKPVFLKMALYICPQDLKSSEFLTCPSQVALSLQLWDILPSPSTQPPPSCSASNMWC